MIDWLIANWIELAGFVTGAACVWLLVIRNIWTFPVGMVNYCLLYTSDAADD